MESPVRTDWARTRLIHVQVRLWPGGQTGRHISASLQTLEKGKVVYWSEKIEETNGSDITVRIQTVQILQWENRRFKYYSEEIDGPDFTARRQTVQILQWRDRRFRFYSDEPDGSDFTVRSYAVQILQWGKRRFRFYSEEIDGSDFTVRR
jgi:hypothetical protein